VIVQYVVPVVDDFTEELLVGCFKQLYITKQTQGKMCVNA